MCFSFSTEVHWLFLCVFLYNKSYTIPPTYLLLMCQTMQILLNKERMNESLERVGSHPNWAHCTNFPRQRHSSAVYLSQPKHRLGAPITDHSLPDLLQNGTFKLSKFWFWILFFCFILHSWQSRSTLKGLAK